MWSERYLKTKLFSSSDLFAKEQHYSVKKSSWYAYLNNKELTEWHVECLRQLHVGQIYLSKRVRVSVNYQARFLKSTSSYQVHLIFNNGKSRYLMSAFLNSTFLNFVIFVIYICGYGFMPNSPNFINFTMPSEKNVF